MQSMITPVHKLIRRFLPVAVKHRMNRWVQRAGMREFVEVEVKGRTPVVVYQVGKVGSTSVTLSLREYNKVVWQVHEISPARLQQIIQHAEDGYARWEYVRRQVKLGRKIYRRVTRNRPTQFITLVRDPVAITVASFFNNLDLTLGTEAPHEKYSIDELIAFFHEKGYATSTWYTSWFDRELQPGLGIDVYSHPFDAAAGWSRIQQGNIDLLILKLEMDDNRKSEAIAAFAGIRDFELSRHHVRSEKPEAPIYDVFKQKLKLTDETLDIHYNTPWAKHFYSEAEIQKFRARWRKERD